MANDRSVQTVRGLLTDSKQTQGAIDLFSKSDAWNGALARMANQLSQFQDKELSSTLTTTNRFLRFLDTPAVMASTETSSFGPEELLNGKTTVYLVLPPEHMRAQSALLRMWVTALVRAVVKGGLKNKNKVHFILDEMASIGHMNAIDDAIDKYRAYGVRLQFYFQSLGQLKKCFREGQDQTLLSNTTQVFFGVNDVETAELISKRLGDSTIVVTSGSKSTSGGRNNPDVVVGNQTGSSNRGWSDTENWAQHGRPLLKPDEVIRLNQRIAITFTPGCPAIKTWLTRYYESTGERTGVQVGRWAGLRCLAASFILAAISGATALCLGAVFSDRALVEQQQAAPFQPFNPLMPQQQFHPAPFPQ